MERVIARLGMIVAIGCLAVADAGAEPTPAYHPVQCAGTYPHHLQGVCIDGEGAIFWSFTTRLVKTDREGVVLREIEVGNHHGDLCFQAGKLFVAVNFGKFNDSGAKADSWIYVYDASDLKLLDKHPTPDVVYGAGGIAARNGQFLVVGGLPAETRQNLVYEYDSQFKLIKKHELPGGYTLMGIQTAAFADGEWWFGCYGKPAILLKANAALGEVQRFEFDAALGIVPLGEGKFLVGRDRVVPQQGHVGSLILAEAEELHGLRTIE